jgi:hypothetical protein
MPAITIPLPSLESAQHIEIEARINGRKQVFSYRVEIFPWERCEEPTEERALCLRRMIAGYDKDWQLVQIGTPTERDIQIMFKQRN